MPVANAPLPVVGTYSDNANGGAQVAAYQVTSDLTFPPGPDIRLDESGYSVWVNGNWQRVTSTDWIVGSGKSGSRLSNAGFGQEFVAVIVDQQMAL